ncbi:putative pentatricopeptide repeat-containing protein At1g53330 [Pistacia vera]|uniref:putative pentatricopeptide repeat-containing protein At1g53330 n=1 Tax=Pistacia vera TaxID=55513 RepID=UPI001262F347|nr:putative pentatricopeptide repeat-containing protein At1g53330 [Pistacia vera]
MTNPKLISSFRLSSLLRLQKDPKLALQLFQNPNPNTSQTPPVKPFRYSHLNYDLIITKLGRAKMFDEMRQILHQLKQDTRISPEEIIFCNVIGFYGRARLCEHALLVFDEMPSFRVQRTVKSFNSLLSAILKCRRFDKMREVFARMEEDGSADSCSYNILIHGCVVNGKLKEAWSVFGAMLRRGLKADEVTFGTLIYGLCLELRLKQASKLKDDMVRVYKVRPNENVYASLIKGYCDVGELSLAFRLKEEMVRNEMEVDTAVYSTFISALFKAGRKADAFGVLEEMRENGCKMNIVTYNAMINGFCNERDFEAAFKVLDEIGENGCKADVISYNVILGGLCKEGKLSEANDLLEDMPRRGCAPDVVSYRILFDGLCDGMQFKAAASILDEMIFKGHVPRTASVHKFINGLCQVGDMECLWTVLSTLTRGNVIDYETWRMIVSTVCKENELSNASELNKILIIP